MPSVKALKDAGTLYRFVGNHAEDIEGGVMLGPGDTCTLDDTQINEGKNKDLIDSGKLIVASGGD